MQWKGRFDEIKEQGWAFERANKGIAVNQVCIPLSILWSVQLQRIDQTETVREKFRSQIFRIHIWGTHCRNTARRKLSALQLCNTGRILITYLQQQLLFDANHTCHCKGEILRILLQPDVFLLTCFWKLATQMSLLDTESVFFRGMGKFSSEMVLKKSVQYS